MKQIFIHLYVAMDHDLRVQLTNKLVDESLDELDHYLNDLVSIIPVAAQKTIGKSHE